MQQNTHQYIIRQIKTVEYTDPQQWSNHVTEDSTVVCFGQRCLNLSRTQFLFAVKQTTNFFSKICTYWIFYSDCGQTVTVHMSHLQSLQRRSKPLWTSAVFSSSSSSHTLTLLRMTFKNPPYLILFKGKLHNDLRCNVHKKQWYLSPRPLAVRRRPQVYHFSAENVVDVEV